MPHFSMDEARPAFKMLFQYMSDGSRFRNAVRLLDAGARSGRTPQSFRNMRLTPAFVNFVVGLFRQKVDFAIRPDDVVPERQRTPIITEVSAEPRIRIQLKFFTFRWPYGIPTFSVGIIDSVRAKCCCCCYCCCCCC